MKADKFKVRGYIKKHSSFHTMAEVEAAVNFLLSAQNSGIDTRSGELSCKLEKCSGVSIQNAQQAINHYFGHLKDDVNRYDLLTDKNFHDFIEDFINHKFWSFDQKYGKYFYETSNLLFSHFYSRGDIEPYVLLDEEFTQQIYGSNFIPMEVCHFTSEKGLKNLISSIDNNDFFDISTMTVKARDFFRSESNIEVRLIGNVKAAFRSDVKSLAVDSGHRAANLERFEYPGRDKTNLCYDLGSCDEELRTGIWNEIIVTPLRIVDYRVVKT